MQPLVCYTESGTWGENHEQGSCASYPVSDLSNPDLIEQIWLDQATPGPAFIHHKWRNIQCGSSLFVLFNIPLLS